MSVIGMLLLLSAGQATIERIPAYNPGVIEFDSLIVDDITGGHLRGVSLGATDAGVLPVVGQGMQVSSIDAGTILPDEIRYRSQASLGVCDTSAAQTNKRRGDRTFVCQDGVWQIEHPPIFIPATVLDFAQPNKGPGEGVQFFTYALPPALGGTLRCVGGVNMVFTVGSPGGATGTALMEFYDITTQAAICSVSMACGAPIGTVASNTCVNVNTSPLANGVGLRFNAAGSDCQANTQPSGNLFMAVRPITCP